MKTIHKLIPLSILALLNLFGCNKYEDGPDFSLLTAEDRLVGTWDVKKYYDQESDLDYVDITTDFEIEFHSDGDFEMSYHTNLGYTSFYGDWKFNDDNTEIHIELNDGREAQWEINRLSRKELWFEAPYLEAECQKK